MCDGVLHCLCFVFYYFSVVDARPTKTCVAPVDASRDFIYFLRTSSVGGGGAGGMLPDFFFCSLFPVQQTTSGIGHRVK